MPANGIFIVIDANSAAFDAALAKSNKSLVGYSFNLKKAQAAQAQYDAAVAKSGIASTEARLAQEKLGAALARTTLAEQKAALAAKQTAEIQAAASAKAAAAAEAASVKQAAAARRLGTVFGTIGTAAAIGLGLAAKAASDFEAQVAKIQTLSGATASEMQALTQAASGFADLGISASEAADAEIELVKAGVSVKDILGGGLQGALQLAAAGQLAVADATSIAAQAMTQFGLAGSDIPHIADLLSAGANKALGSVQDLGVGLSYAGGPAHQLGVSIEDTVATLAEFAQAGLIGEKGGAALQTMFARLVKPTAAAKDVLDKYNISLYDSKGAFVGMSALAGQFQTNLSGLSLETRNAALQTVFGNRAFRAAAILYQDGAKGAEEWAKKVNDTGNAARTTAGQMNSLKGDMQKLSAEFHNAAIDLGQRLQPALREVTQDATALIGAFDGLPGPVKDFAANMTVAVAAVGLGVFAFSRLKLAGASLARTLGVVTAAEATAGEASLLMGARSTIAANKMLLLKGAMLGAAVGLATLNSHIDNKEASGLLNIATGAAAGAAAFGPWGAAVGAAAGTALTLSQNLPGVVTGLTDITTTLDKSTGAATKATHAWALAAAVNFGPALDAAGISTTTFTKALLGNENAMGAVYIGAAKLGPLLGPILTKAIDDAASSSAAFNKKITDTAIAVGQLHNPAVSAAAAARQLGGVVAEFGEGAVSTAGDVKILIDATDGLSKAEREAYTNAMLLDNAMLGLRGDLRNQKAATDAATKSVKEHGKTLHGNIPIYGESAELLDGMAAAALNVADDFKAGSAKQVQSLQTARHELVNTAVQMGASKEAAWEYVNSVLAIPDRATTSIDTPGLLTAADGVAALARAIANLHGKSITINTNYTQSGVQSDEGYIPHRAAGGKIPGYPMGGKIRGIGTGTSDSNLIAASRGEWVIREVIGRREGDRKMAALNAGRATIVPRPTQYLANGGMAGSQAWRGGGSTTVVLDAGAIRRALDGMTVTVANGAEIGGQVRLTAKQAINQTQALHQREALAGRSQ